MAIGIKRCCLIIGRDVEIFNEQDAVCTSGRQAHVQL